MKNLIKYKFIYYDHGFKNIFSRLTTIIFHFYYNKNGSYSFKKEHLMVKNACKKIELN